MSSRSVARLVTAHRQTEGGGFIVRRPFPGRQVDFVDPFLLLDEMGPIEYAPGEAVGAPDHPHRGFETVTYMLEGESEHEDSAGNRGVLAAGDVQWMTAGAGVVHSEMPSARVQKEGGRAHGFQIWVNLPMRDKMMPPRYQDVPRAKIPTAQSADGLAEVTVVAGRALGVSAVIETRTPITYLDWRLKPGAHVTPSIPEDQQAMVYVFKGAVKVAGQPVNDGQLAVLSQGDTVSLESAVDSRLLLLAGVPLNEPVARYGPFVMNTESEIRQAFEDFRAGRMGEIRR